MPFDATAACSISIIQADHPPQSLRYFEHNGVICSPFIDVERLSGIARNSDSRSETLSDLQPHTFMAKLGRQTGRCAPTLRLLQAANVYTASTAGKLCCRHLIHLIEAFTPGDALPMDYTIVGLCEEIVGPCG